MKGTPKRQSRPIGLARWTESSTNQEKATWPALLREFGLMPSTSNLCSQFLVDAKPFHRRAHSKVWMKIGRKSPGNEKINHHPFSTVDVYVVVAFQTSDAFDAIWRKCLSHLDTRQYASSNLKIVFRNRRQSSLLHGPLRIRVKLHGQMMWNLNRSAVRVSNMQS